MKNPFRSRLGLLAAAASAVMAAICLLALWNLNAAARAATEDAARALLAADADWLRGLPDSAEAARTEIERRASANADMGLTLLALAEDGARIAGTQEAWPGPAPSGPRPQAASLALEDGSADVLQIAITMKSGLSVYVARRLADPRGLLSRADGIAVIAVLAMAIAGIAGSLLVAGYAARRIEAVNAVCRAVEAGDLSARVGDSAASDEFGQLSRHVNAMLARIGAAMEGLRLATERVAHELRTPLTRLKIGLESAVEDAGPEGRARIENALQESERALRLFEGILDLSSLRSGGAPAMEPVDLSEAVRDVVSLYEAVAEEKGIALTAEGAASAMVMGARDLLVQLVVNLADNAIKHGGAGGRVRLRVSVEGGRAALDCIDDGPGFSEAIKSRAFDPFVRTRGPAEGFGLGLSLARAIAEAHGGTLEIVPSEVGAHLRLTLDARQT